MHRVMDQVIEIQKVFQRLKVDSETDGVLILVEGRKDLESLQNLGIINNILLVQGHPLTEICDIAASYKKVIILTDFDPAGQKIARSIRNDLSLRGINVDMSYYKQLKMYFKTVSKDIESLSKIYHQIQQNPHKRMK
ncbi:MAG: toprim domain-containing protein [Candidatus Helarchaeota archaeon]